MKIINAMLGKQLGGIEHVSVRYAKALAMRGHQVLMVIRSGAEIEKLLLEAMQEYPNLQYKKIRVWGDYDFLAKKKVRKIVEDFGADAIIARGNRAVRIFKKEAAKVAPLIAGTPNYRFKSLVGLSGIVSSTEDMKKAIIAAGHPADDIWLLPNSLEVDAFKTNRETSFHSPVVIGTMGRLVKKKGFHIFIEALHLLAQQGYDFKAKIGGSGEEMHELSELVQQYQLEDKVEFSGWIDDKRAFFEQLDIFVLPSLHEPFGNILLEAFAAKLPVISSDSEGPSEIGEQGKDCLFYSREDAVGLSENMKTMLLNEEQAGKLAENGYSKVKENYNFSVFADRLENIVQTVVARYGKTTDH